MVGCGELHRLLPFVEDLAGQVLVLQLLANVADGLVEVLLVRLEVDQRADVLDVGLLLELLVDVLNTLTDISDI